MSTEIDELLALLAQLDEPSAAPDLAQDVEDDEDPLEPDLEAEWAAAPDPQPNRPLSHGELTLTLQRFVMPSLQHLVARRGSLNLGNLARATHRLQGSEWHLARVRQYVQRARVPVFPARSDRGGRLLPLAAVEQATSYFGDLLRGEPDPVMVVARLGYADVPLHDGTRAFLGQAWINHCLSRAEEQHLAEIVAAEIMQHETRFGSWSPAAMRARELLVLDNLWLVARVARKFLRSGVDIDDLLQAGQLGLLRAVEKHDPTRGNRFVTYAGHWVYQSIHRYIADASSVIRLPVHVQENRATILTARDEIRARAGVSPSIAEIAVESGLAESAVRGILVTGRPLSLDAPGRRAFVNAHAIREDEGEDEELRRLREQIDTVLATLTDREQHVIEQRFGLRDGDERTLEEVGQGFGVTRERIRQIEAKALKRLRHPSRARALRPFVDDTVPSQSVRTTVVASKEILALAASRFDPQERTVLSAIFCLGDEEPQSREAILKKYKLSAEQAAVLENALYATAQRYLVANPLASTPIMLVGENADGKQRVYKRKLRLPNFGPPRRPSTPSSRRQTEQPGGQVGRTLLNPNASVSEEFMPPLIRAMRQRPSVAQVAMILPRLSQAEREAAELLYGTAGRRSLSIPAVAKLLHTDTSSVAKLDVLIRCFVLEFEYKNPTWALGHDSDGFGGEPTPGAPTSPPDGNPEKPEDRQGLLSQVAAIGQVSPTIPMHSRAPQGEAHSSQAAPYSPDAGNVSITPAHDIESQSIERGDQGISAESSPRRDLSASGAPDAPPHHKHGSPMPNAPTHEDVRALLVHFEPYERLIADALLGLTTGTPMPIEAVAREFGVSLDQTANVAAAMRLLSEAHTLGVPTIPPLPASDAVPSAGAPAQPAPTSDPLAILGEAAPSEPPSEEEPIAPSPTDERAEEVLSPAQQALATFEPGEVAILDMLLGINARITSSERAVATRFDLPLGHIRRLQWKFERRLAVQQAAQEVEVPPRPEKPPPPPASTASIPGERLSPIPQPTIFPVPAPKPTRSEVVSPGLRDAISHTSVQLQELAQPTSCPTTPSQSTNLSAGQGGENTAADGTAPTISTSQAAVPTQDARTSFRRIATSIRRWIAR